MHYSLVSVVGALCVGVGLPLLPAPALAAPCSPDSTPVGPVCIDTYEASVWEIPGEVTLIVHGHELAVSNKGLIKKVQQGTATLADLTSPTALTRGVVQHGLGITGDYPCSYTGNDCTTIYAVSIPGVLPSANITWFQAQQACGNAGKRLLTNAEWQMAAAGTPDGPVFPCNIDTGAPTLTGSNVATFLGHILARCESRWGVRRQRVHGTSSYRR